MLPALPAYMEGINVEGGGGTSRGLSFNVCSLESSDSPCCPSDSSKTLASNPFYSDSYLLSALPQALPYPLLALSHGD